MYARSLHAHDEPPAVSRQPGSVIGSKPHARTNSVSTNESRKSSMNVAAAWRTL